MEKCLNDSIIELFLANKNRHIFKSKLSSLNMEIEDDLLNQLFDNRNSVKSFKMIENIF